MPPSTSPASPPLPEEAARFGLEAIDAFYGLHAAIYDWTRPFLLSDRGEAVRALGLRPGERVLDVGCGTGWSLPRLRARGAQVVGIEPSSPMRRQARARLERHRLAGVVDLDPRPYGSHGDYEGTADAVLFSYSLSMIPPFEEALERARLDLRPGGRIVVVDFLDAWGPVGLGLRRSHVHLGPDRLRTLRRLFPRHHEAIRSVGLWGHSSSRARAGRRPRSPGPSPGLLHPGHAGRLDRVEHGPHDEARLPHLRQLPLALAYDSTPTSQLYAGTAASGWRRRRFTGSG
jgi:S-adenosylmethionine-diacylgycerolhomoserine-N-methlytransferase